MTRLARFLTLAAVVALIAGLPLPPAAHAQKAFKMGAIVPVSGPAAAFGLGVQRGMELAAEDIGTMTVGSDKYKLEVVTYDTVYDPGKTVAAMNRAVYNDGVKYGIIIGAGVHPPILPIIRETGFLDLAFAAAGRQLTNSENPTVFRIMASSDQLYQTYLGPIIERLGIKRVAFLGPNDELGKNDGKLVKAQVETMKGKGVQFVADEYYERGAKDFSEAQRLQMRQDLSVPILGQFHRWLEAQRPEVLPKSPMAEALGYALNNWAALIRYTEAGFLTIDNNVSEREMKRIAIGRKNWLTVGSPRGGRTAAVLFSFTSTCQRLGVEPWAYLQDVLTRLPTMPAGQLGDLLPDHWQTARKAQTAIPTDLNTPAAGSAS
jgi:hypothetical protein